MIVDASTIDPRVRLDLYEVPRRMMDAVIRSDCEQFLDCFTADGIWDPSPLAPRAEGKEAIGRTFRDAWDTLVWGFQGHFHTVIVTFSDDRAQLRTYLYESAVVKASEGAPPIGLGVYADDMVLVDGKWKVALHDLSLVYFGSGDYAQPMFQQPQR